MDIKQATKAYERWLAKRIPLLEPDLRVKHQRMAESPFPFLRATFYRWVQLWPKVCRELTTAPTVLGVGDLHVENFGTWRDREGRLVWGANDFDEAAQLPYTNDLVRLAASAGIAISENQLSCDADEACEAILIGYQEGIARGGAVFVLAEKHGWLWDLVVSKLRNPVAFWQKLDQLPTLRVGIPAVVRQTLGRLLPEPRLSYRIIHRRAGLGGLGRRRFTVLADWRGGRIAREAKELVESAWNWERNRRTDARILYKRAVEQVVRVPDPFVEIHGQWLIRRLAPDCSRIALGSLPRSRDELKLLHAMGWETANIHLGSKEAVHRVRQDLKKRPVAWLRKSSKAMTQATFGDWKKWAKA